MNKKICVSCKIEKPLNDFNKNRNSPDGYKNYCRLCASEQNKRYREKHRETINEKKKNDYWESKRYSEEKTAKELEEKNRVCSICGIEQPIENYYARGNGGFYNYCKDCHNKSVKEYANENREAVLRRKRKYYQKNREHAIKYFKSYNIKNSKKNIERANKWYHSNIEKARELSRNSYHRRKARQQNLIDDFTIDDWNYCIDYFRDSKGEAQCAYCGKQTDNLTQDHFIPVAKNGHYTKTNILPVCGNCNSQKIDSDFYEWYPTKDFYSELNVRKIEKYLNEINYENPEPSIVETL